MKDASSIGAALHLPVCARSRQSVRGLTSNLLWGRSQKLLIHEIRLQQTSMFRAATGQACSLFRDRISADIRRGWATKNLPSSRIADYFPSWRSRQAHMGDSL